MIKYCRFSPTGSNGQYLDKLVACYRQVFAAQPWGEWRRCAVCQCSWGIEDVVPSTHCSTPVKEFWPAEKVVKDIQHEVSPAASCWLALDGDLVVGFTWAYPIERQTLETKLGLSFNDTELASQRQLIYQDEVGVIASYRQRGIAKALVARRHHDLETYNLKYCVVRTRALPKPTVTFNWYQRLGYRIAALYPHDDGRVILYRELAGLGKLLV